MTGKRIGIIGGSGLDALPDVTAGETIALGTPYGAPSAPLQCARLAGCDLVFLPRHGPDHRLPPHAINYRANLWSLRECGVDRVLAVAAVGGISAAMTPARIVIPDGIVDYTWGRAHTYFDGGDGRVEHVDFTFPYDAAMRGTLAATARELDIDAIAGGTYAATQGPRLETAAEIDRLERDGCDIVGMTGMPEAALARELGLRYACIAVIANRAAGRGPGAITMEDVLSTLARGMRVAVRLIAAALPRL
jgi:5'-methylthioinosine phosphorylase